MKISSLSLRNYYGSFYNNVEDGELALGTHFFWLT